MVSYRTILVFLVAINGFSCFGYQSENGNDKDGIWESLGYGRIITIANGEYVLSDVTKFSCLPIMEGHIAEFGDVLKLKNDTLLLTNGINRYYFTRIVEAPPVCKKGSKAYKAAKAMAQNPEHNFEVLWDTFKNHYAYFELRGIDAENMYAKYRPRISPETSEAELFLILYEMLESFDDGHIGINAEKEVLKAASKMYRAQNPLQNEEESFESGEVAEMIAKKYIPNGKSRRGDNLRWGMLEQNIGYVQINEMEGMADYGIKNSLKGDRYWKAYSKKSKNSENELADEVKGINKVIDSILNDFRNVSALIIDLRCNGGGIDEVGMEILKKLNDEEKIVFTKKARWDGGFTPVVKVVQPAVEKPYKKPVYLLIGPESASATEIMALSSLSIPNIKLVGSSTEGIFSDVLEKTLPNGWSFELSNEVYLDMKGNNYESIGIPPDIPIDYPRDIDAYFKKLVDDLKIGDAAITKVIEIVN
ncbi:MAG: S41 family peptidase [Croceivirga sp.]